MKGIGMTLDEIRESFEAWAKDAHPKSVIPGWNSRDAACGVYLDLEVASSWLGWVYGWRAANAASVVHLRDLSAEDTAELLNVFASESNQVAPPGMTLEQSILDEREACAKACEEVYVGTLSGEMEAWDIAARDCAEAIRNRSTIK